MVYIKRYSTIFLNIAVFIGGTVLALLIFGLPWVVSGLVEVIPVPHYVQYLGFIGLYGSVIPFLLGLYQTIKFLISINKDKVFSGLSIKTLKNIKYYAITISALYVIGMPLLYLMGEKDDAPGIILFGLIVILVTGVSAVFVSVFQKRCHE